jgi:hypothetical protein
MFEREIMPYPQMTGTLDENILVTLQHIPNPSYAQIVTEARQILRPWLLKGMGNHEGFLSSQEMFKRYVETKMTGEILRYKTASWLTADYFYAITAGTGGGRVTPLLREQADHFYEMSMFAEMAAKQSEPIHVFVICYEEYSRMLKSSQDDATAAKSPAGVILAKLLGNLNSKTLTDFLLELHELDSVQAANLIREKAKIALEASETEWLTSLIRYDVHPVTTDWGYEFKYQRNIPASVSSITTSILLMTVSFLSSVIVSISVLLNGLTGSAHTQRSLLTSV